MMPELLGDLVQDHPDGCGLEPQPHEHVIRLRSRRRPAPASSVRVVVAMLEQGGAHDRELAGRLRGRFGIPPATDG